MANDAIIKALIDCLDGSNLDSEKFFSAHPWSESVKKSLYELRNKGYIVVDEGDNRITDIDATKKLLDLAKANH